MLLRGRAVVICAILPAYSLFARVSSAQNSPAAEELYRRGVDHFQAGDFKAACSELSESYRMEELPGVLFTLATCEARAGSVASAVAHFEDFLGYAARLTPAQRLAQKDREVVARKELQALRPRVPRVAITFSRELEPNTKIELDGGSLLASVFTAPLPLDPGAHRLVVRGTTGSDVETSFFLREGEQTSFVVAVPEQRKESRSADKSGEEASSAWSWVFGTIAGVGVATGATAGVVALVEKGKLSSHCVGTLCDAEGLSAVEQGRSAALISTIAFSVGAAGAVGLVTVQLLATPSENVALRFNGSSLEFEGAF